MTEPTYTAGQVAQAFNQAADDIQLIETTTDEEHANLMVAVGVGYLTGEASTVADAVEANWAGDAQVTDGRLTFGHWTPDEDTDEQDGAQA